MITSSFSSNYTISKMFWLTSVRNIYKLRWELILKYYRNWSLLSSIIIIQCFNYKSKITFYFIFSFKIGGRGLKSKWKFSYNWYLGVEYIIFGAKLGRIFAIRYIRNLFAMCFYKRIWLVTKKDKLFFNVSSC